MAVLVLQLARYGDIFQTRPTLNALRRKFPEEEIHLLVRERFADAASVSGIPGVIVHSWPSSSILAPILERESWAEAGEILNKSLAKFTAIKFSRIVNLSFSPFSSYLAEAISAPGTAIVGYTRQADGYLSIPDDTSAYFYAQVGVGRHNRYHLTDIFAAVAGVDLEERDFSLGMAPTPRDSSVIVHIGASEAGKIYPATLWRETLKRLCGRVGPLILVGNAAERGLAEAAAEGMISTEVENRVGQSTIVDLVKWIGSSRLVIGADSAPVHIAALTATPVLNLSCSVVNFWETGPRSAGSRILFAPRIAEIDPETVATEALAMCGVSPAPARFAECMGPLAGFHLANPADAAADFYWRLIQALYTAHDFPPLPARASALGFHRLFDIADLAVGQLRGMRLDGQSGATIGILSSIDQMLEQLPRLDPLVEPVISWFQTERLRIGPGGATEILRRTLELFEQLALIAAVYRRFDGAATLVERASALTGACAPLFREFKADEAGPHFQELLTVLQDLSRHATKVGGDWSSVLLKLNHALGSGDLIEVADLLESELPGRLRAVIRETETSGQDVIL